MEADQKKIPNRFLFKIPGVGEAAVSANEDGGDGPPHSAVIYRDDGSEQHLLHAELEMDHTQNESPFVIRAYRSAKDYLDEHPATKKAVEGSAGVVVLAGVATSILAFRRHKKR